MTDMFFEVPRSKRDRSLSNYFFDLELGTPVDVRLDTRIRVAKECGDAGL